MSETPTPAASTQTHEHGHVQEALNQLSELKVYTH